MFNQQNILQAFTKPQFELAKLYLATQVTTMMGRKLEEGDWSSVYCKAKGIPDGGWSNLNIDVNHKGLGLELKVLRIAQLNGRALKNVCGTTLMHPSATRSIRIDDVNQDANVVMNSVLQQYAELIELRTQKVRQLSEGAQPDMRTGWLIWEDNLTEFLYFEERMVAPAASNYFAAWNDTGARGARKSSRSLWIYDKVTEKKRYSITTSAGIKIQPYFDVPAPTDPNLCYFRVQGEKINADTILLWVSFATAEALKAKLGSLDKATVSKAILKIIQSGVELGVAVDGAGDYAQSIPVDASVYHQLVGAWEACSDEHRGQLLLKALNA
jgi:hypothetical protein